MAAPLNNRAFNPNKPTDDKGVPELKSEASANLANILIVDDRKEKRLAIKSVLDDLGQNIIEAVSGRDALRHLLKNEFAVILLDVNMPDLDGFETALLIRENKRLESVPIIFVSAVSDAETHVSRGYSLGAVDYILAPIVPEVLRTKVSVFVDLYKITNEVKRQAEDLRLAHIKLEERVEQRTNQLAIANQNLVEEIFKRKRIEEELRELNLELEERVSSRTSELLMVNKELESFTYSLAHDLRAPFRQIHGYADLLLEEYCSQLPLEGQNYLKRIGVKSREMGQIVDDLLNLFGVIKGDIVFESVDLNKIVAKVVENLDESAAKRNIEWKITELPRVQGNYGLLTQVFDNLVSNALKYTRREKIAHIAIGCENADNQNIIFIRDNGVGFDMESAGKLFGLFQRLHSSPEFEGNGVGLALTSKIIHKHGGRIWAESHVSKGASFYFTLGKE